MRRPFQTKTDKKKTILKPAVHDIVLDVERVLVVVHVAVHRHLHQEETDVGRDNLSQSCDHPGIKKELFLENIYILKSTRRVILRN